MAPESPEAAAGGVLAAPADGLQAVVVVPARDEAERIGACLAALTAQTGVSPEAYEIIVVLDGCVDATGARIAQARREHRGTPLHVLELARSRGVGRARRLGMDVACERLLAVGRSDGLIASTDADSTVAADWLAAQLALRDAGAAAIGGRVELDGAHELASPVVAERRHSARERLLAVRREADPAAVVEHHHFSGASLALTAAAYRSCGGLPVRAALEDEALERELRARGVVIHRSDRVRVRTAVRRHGRAPRGLAHDLLRSDWRARRTYAASRFPRARLLEAKRETVALVMPARDVEQTIGPIAACAAELRAAGLLDEALVIDAASRDRTALIAAREGVDVVQEDDIAASLGPCRGKGDAMWRALSIVRSDIVAFVDTDTERFEEHFVTGLLGPLLCEPDVAFVKGFFRRPFRSGETISAHGGGRVTELMARPLLNLHAPELSVFEQPLAGETAARRELLEQLPFSAGYGVEIALLIDAWRALGLDGLAQVDLGVRQNRHQPLRELSAMAYAVLVAAQSRFLGGDWADAHASGSIYLPAHGGGPMEARRVPMEERPPLRTVGAAATSP